MKKIGLLGSALGALLMQGLAHGAGWSTGPSKRPGARNWLKGTGRTTDKRHWHNPSDPRQAARIEAAAAKRKRRRDKFHHYASWATVHNPTICTYSATGVLESIQKNLNTSYAK